MRLPFDAKRQMHLEYAEWTDAMKAKQADTIMLSYPLGVDMPVAVRRNDLDYYANHTGNGPSMTWSMYAVVSLRETFRTVHVVILVTHGYRHCGTGLPRNR